MFLNQSKKTNQFPALHILLLVVSCFFNMSYCKSVGASDYLRVPPAPKYDYSLTNEDIEFLLAGCEDPEIHLIAWDWIEELIRHGNEPDVQLALNNAAVPNHPYRIQATFALFFLEDDPSSIYRSILDMLENGTDTEKANVRFLLPDVLTRESDSRYIPETLELLTSDDPLVRETVIKTVMNFPDEPGVIPAIFASAKDDSPDVRFQAGYALTVIAKNNPSLLNNPEGKQLLTDLMLHDEWQGARGGAFHAAAICCIDDPEILSIVTDELQNESDPTSRWIALASLSGSPRKDITLPLIRLGLEDSDPGVRQLAEDILGITELRKAEKIRNQAIGAGLIIIVLVGLAVISVLYFRRRGKKQIHE